MTKEVIDDLVSALMKLAGSVEHAKDVAATELAAKSTALDKKLTDALNAYKTQTDARLTALEKK